MTKIPVFFRDEQVAPEQGYSPSAAKPAQVMAEWKRRKFPIEVRSFLGASTTDLRLAHDAKYVRDVLSCDEENGFGTRDPRVAASLPFTTGSMIAAAREAYETRSVACSPTSGFHHACWDMGGGFCTFNGLVSAARVLLADGAKRVGILDCDQHYGNGTDDILDKLQEIQPGAAARIFHVTMGQARLRRGQGPEYLRQVDVALDEFAKAGTEVVLYQAGADPHVNDPLGGLLTSEELRERDRLVFTTCKRLGMGVAWNLAGGYQRDADGGIQPVLDIHNATMEECIAVYGGV